MLGHAIDAAEIATVGDRHAQIFDLPAEGIDEMPPTPCWLISNQSLCQTFCRFY